MPASTVKIKNDKIHYTKKLDFINLFEGENMPELSMDEVIKLVGLQLGKRNVQRKDRLVEDLGAESADVANLVAVVEGKYGITIKESEIARIFTSDDLFALIQKRMQ
jgi:acyl carrier protein